MPRRDWWIFFCLLLSPRRARPPGGRQGSKVSWISIGPGLRRKLYFRRSSGDAASVVRDRRCADAGDDRRGMFLPKRTARTGPGAWPETSSFQRTSFDAGPDGQSRFRLSVCARSYRRWAGRAGGAGRHRFRPNRRGARVGALPRSRRTLRQALTLMRTRRAIRVIG